MSMPDLSKVRLVLREHLLTTVVGVTDVMVAPENRKFTPPDPTPRALWIQEHLLPDGTPQVASRTIEGRGRAQFDVVCVQGEGTERAEALAKLIQQAFEPSTHLSSQGIQIAIDRCDPAPGREFDKTWWFIPISISWRTYTQTVAV